MIVTATELANESKSILDRVVQGGEVVEVQRHGKTVAVIQPRTGASRSELLRLLRGRGFNARDSKELKAAMDVASHYTHAHNSTHTRKHKFILEKLDVEPLIKIKGIRKGATGRTIRVIRAIRG